MDFFDEVDDIDGRLAVFEYAEGKTTLSFESQPATEPIQVEAVTVLLVALNWGVDKFHGYLGDVRLTLEYDGVTYPLAYASYPRAVEVRTDQVVHAPEFISDRHEVMGYALSYTLPLARNQVFLIHPGLSATMHVTRDIRSGAVLKTGMKMLIGAELSSDLGIMSTRKRLLRRELNAHELQALEAYDGQAITELEEALPNV